MTKKQKIFRITVTLLLLVTICLAIYLPLTLSGAFDKINSAQELKQIIIDAGAYSYVLFFFIQFLQVTFVPIPAIITTLAGALVFGPWWTLLISTCAIMLGAVASFFIGKSLGRKAIIWCFGAEQATRFNKLLAKGKYTFFLMMLFPLFPDDMLCMIVGAAGMSFRYFFMVNLITRPLSIAATCFLGSGQIIPYRSWGLVVWAALLCIAGLAFYFSIKYRDKIEAAIQKLSHK